MGFIEYVTKHNIVESRRYLDMLKCKMLSMFRDNKFLFVSM